LFVKVENDAKIAVIDILASWALWRLPDVAVEISEYPARLMNQVIGAIFF
jgi:hypothetical protein